MIEFERRARAALMEYGKDPGLVSVEDGVLAWDDSELTLLEAWRIYDTIHYDEVICRNCWLLIGSHRLSLSPELVGRVYDNCRAVRRSELDCGARRG